MDEDKAEWCGEKEIGGGIVRKDLIMDRIEIEE